MAGREAATSTPTLRTRAAPSEPLKFVEAQGSEPLLFVTDPSILRALELDGYSLGALLFGLYPGLTDNAELWKSSRYQEIASVLMAEVNSLRAADPLAGVDVARFPHRTFNTKWLGSSEARFELVAVVNRFDRQPFRPETCGETRLVYRLSYSGTRDAAAFGSRLPVTLAVEFDNQKAGDGCRGELERWLPLNQSSPAQLARFLTSSHGPLASLRGAARPHRVLVNLQLVRWPSAVKPDLGGHAEYLLRAFKWEGDRYHAALLENTPDPKRLQTEPRLRQELIEWLGEPDNLRRIDSDYVQLPAQFLAERSISVTPRGPSRGANRPFSAALANANLANIDFSTLSSVRSAAGLLRRLDGLTCAGCHQARSLAGFHVLGEDAPGTPLENAVAVSHSPHMVAELERRGSMLRRMLIEPWSAEPPALPFPERGSYASYGARCGIGSDPSFAHWKCEAGLTCQALDTMSGDPVGQCLPARPQAAGDPCEVGAVRRNKDPKRDQVQSVSVLNCPELSACNSNSVGFPAGMCMEACSHLSPSSACGAIALLEPFNACLARKVPFLTCLREHTQPAGLRACSVSVPCRDDYLCAGGAGHGTCIPPYFLFQLRVDGHPG